MVVKNIEYIPNDNQIPKSNLIYKLNCSIMFIDIRNSSKMTKTLGEKEMTKIYKMFSKIVIYFTEYYDGKINQIVGDGIFCTFTNDYEESSALKAINAAININKFLNNTFVPYFNNNKNFKCGIGICTGEIYFTKLGSKGRNNVSAAAYPGKITNKASHYCDKARGNEILFDKNTYDKIKKLKNNIKYCNDESYSLIIDERYYE